VGNSLSNHYVMISNSEDGGVRLRYLSRHELEQELEDAADEGRELRVFNETVLAGKARGVCGWDFANEGERGCVIFKTSGLVVPKVIERVTRYELG
jgi:hypothetical protein